MADAKYVMPCFEKEKKFVKNYLVLCISSDLSPVYTNSGASDFCHVRPILPGCPFNFARLSDWFWDRNFPISLSNFVQCDVCQSDAYKNWTDGLAKSIRQQKSDWFWLFRVNDPLVMSPIIKDGPRLESWSVVRCKLLNKDLLIRPNRLFTTRAIIYIRAN